MDFFINEILENNTVKEILLKDEDCLSKEAKSIANGIIQTGDMPKLKAGILPIFVLAYLASYALDKNNKREIPWEITVATLKDVNIWLDNYNQQFGEYGLAEFNWLFYHYTGDLFRIGRLQFRIEKCLDGIPSGSYALETHIPQGERLDNNACLHSFDCAKTFFKKHFPDTVTQYFMCDSWLLNRNLEMVLPSQSNIVNFMKLWTPIPFPSDNSAQAIERVFGFGFKADKIKNAPENTSLQKKLKSFLLAGGELNITAGYRKI